MQKCERCNASLEGFDLTDYCAHCSKNLCRDCMEKGCCGHVPAESGMAADYDADDEQGCADPGNVYPSPGAANLLYAVPAQLFTRTPSTRRQS